MSKSKTIVRPKAPVRSQIQEWVVLREDPETREVECFEIQCVKGAFFTHYRALGLIDGTTPFDPYLDMDEGRMERQLVTVHR